MGLCASKPPKPSVQHERDKRRPSNSQVILEMRSSTPPQTLDVVPIKKHHIAEDNSINNVLHQIIGHDEMNMSTVQENRSIHARKALSSSTSMNECFATSEDAMNGDSVVSQFRLIRDTEMSITLPRYADDDFRMKEYQAMHSGKRNSIVEYIESVRRMHDKTRDYMIKKRTGTLMDNAADHIIFLARGGTYVSTKSCGPIQFGLPPETIKDCITEGLKLPVNFVLPKQRFNLQTGINVAEFEFPAYFNFFVQRKRINLITTPEVEPLIRAIFQQTLLGPTEIQEPRVYSKNVPKESYPDLLLESKYFRKNPFNPSEELSVDTLLQFTHFKEQEWSFSPDDTRVLPVAELDGGNVKIVDVGEEYIVYDNNIEIATIQSHVIVSPPALNNITNIDDDNDDNDDDHNNDKNPGKYHGLQRTYDKNGNEIMVFVPPVFGVTMLGNSHGFDANGTTTGFVLWINRRGIMVDPPPHSGAILKQNGIPSRLIRGIILSHCHADHDAGTFQKILEEGRVVLYTTRVILNSFLTKYAAISGLEQSFLIKLFEFREVIIGEKMSVYGGQLEFHYSLHSIPCVGFAAYSCGQSMVYSGDTFHDEKGIQKIFEDGFISKGRRDCLLNFPWHHTVILHEAGVPPIHTPMKTLTSLPQHVKDRLYVVHVAAKDIPTDSGLKPALVGPENTIVISNERSADYRNQELLELVSNVDLFEDFPITRACEILNAAKYVTYNAGHDLIKQGSLGDTMYVIAMGIVAVVVDGNLVKKLTVGDHFGEMSIVTQLPRTATITSLTHLELIEFSGHEFMHLVRDTNAVERLRHLGLMQREASWQCINYNSVLSKWSSTQKTYLQSILHKVEAKRGDILWEQNTKAKVAIIVETGMFVFARANTTKPFSRGAFVADMPSLLYGSPVATTLVCAEDGSFYYIPKPQLLKFFDDHPGVLVYFQGLRFVE